MEGLTKTQERAHELVREICDDSPSAFAFYLMLCDASILLDHIVDRDDLDCESAARALKNLLIELPQNEFFATHRASLLPVMSNAISAWEYSNTPGACKTKAFDVYTEVPMAIAFILGGQSRVRRYQYLLRSLQERNMREDDAQDGGKK